MHFIQYSTSLLLYRVSVGDEISLVRFANSNLCTHLVKFAQSQKLDSTNKRTSKHHEGASRKNQKREDNRQFGMSSH